MNLIQFIEFEVYRFILRTRGWWTGSEWSWHEGCKKGRMYYHSRRKINESGFWNLNRNWEKKTNVSYLCSCVGQTTRKFGIRLRQWRVVEGLVLWRRAWITSTKDWSEGFGRERGETDESLIFGLTRKTLYLLHWEDEFWKVTEG